jgi:hypothetical protein
MSRRPNVVMAPMRYSLLEQRTGDRHHQPIRFHMHYFNKIKHILTSRPLVAYNKNTWARRKKASPTNVKQTGTYTCLLKSVDDRSRDDSNVRINICDPRESIRKQGQAYIKYVDYCFVPLRSIREDAGRMEEWWPTVYDKWL